MIAFKDFAPRVLDSGGLLREKTFQSLTTAVEEASTWCAHRNVIPLNVETVVLPDIYDSGQEGSKDVHVRTRDIVEWHQIVRVWYLAK